MLSRVYFFICSWTLMHFSYTNHPRSQRAVEYQTLKTGVGHHNNVLVKIIFVSCASMHQVPCDLQSVYNMNESEPRPRYNAKVLKESFDRENRLFRIHDVFNPSIKAAPITGKFYSKYHGTDVGRVDTVQLQRIRAYQVGTPNQKYAAPVTENQRYGWIPVQLVPLRKGDIRYYAPRTATISKCITVSHMKKK